MPDQKVHRSSLNCRYARSSPFIEACSVVARCSQLSAFLLSALTLRIALLVRGTRNCPASTRHQRFEQAFRFQESARDRGFPGNRALRTPATSRQASNLSSGQEGTASTRILGPVPQLFAMSLSFLSVVA